MTQPPQQPSRRSARARARANSPANPRANTRRRALVETLEKRQLLSAVVDLRLTGGGQSALVTQVGQVVNFDVWVTVTGSDSDPANEGLQIMTGSVLSTNVNGGAALGTLSLTPAAPFGALGSSPGTQADLDGDGDLDVGSNTPSSATGFFAARSSSMTTEGTIADGKNAFRIGTGTFTVTQLLNGAQTQLGWRVRDLDVAPTGFLIQVDGQTQNATNGGTVVAGQSISLAREANGSISGRVFNDKNATGFFDGDDEGISGFRVFLDANLNGLLDEGEISKPVSATGTYTFTGLAAGSYRVIQVQRDGWRTSYPGEGFYDVNLGHGDAARSLSFANTQGVLIKGFVWHDSNADRIRQPIEDPLARWRVIVDLNNNGIWDEGDVSKETNSRGAYRLSLLTHGTFNVMVKQVEGFRQTTNGGFPREITLGPGETTSNKNFGLKRLK